MGRSRRYAGRNLRVHHILEQHGEAAAQAAREALADNAALLVEEAKSRVAVKTGKLRDSIHEEIKYGGDYVKVVADAKDKAGIPYAAVVEFSPRINQPFLYPAFYARRQEMIDHVKAKIRQALRSI